MDTSSNPTPQGMLDIIRPNACLGIGKVTHYEYEERGGDDYTYPIDFSNFNQAVIYAGRSGHSSIQINTFLPPMEKTAEGIDQGERPLQMLTITDEQALALCNLLLKLIHPQQPL